MWAKSDDEVKLWAKSDDEVKLWAKSDDDEVVKLWAVLLQIVKILRFMGLTYHDLHTASKATLYKENTNVFVYYILKCIFLFNMNNFLNWCVKNNTNMIAFDANKDNFTKLSHFIKSKYNSKNFIHGLTQANKLLNKYDSNFIKETMRMSVFEFSL